MKNEIRGYIAEIFVFNRSLANMAGIGSVFKISAAAGVRSGN